MYNFIRFCLAGLATWVLEMPVVAQTDSSVFGSKNFLTNGLSGKIYSLPDTTTRLPDFDTMKALGTIYSKEINIGTRSWTDGFPGAKDQVEWFGIDYRSIFKARKRGLYRFRLLSDDGSKLFIDDKLLIDHDGQHQATSKNGEINLDTSEHRLRLQYFQGPRAQIALQLFTTYQDESEEIFPGNFFVLTTPAENHGIGIIVWTLTLGAAAILLILFFRRKRKKKASDVATDGNIART